MSLNVNLRHLEAHSVRLNGTLPVEELDIQTHDEMLQLEQPLEYDLEVQKLEGGLLLEGCLSLVLSCRCVRCLKPFQHELTLPKWAAHLPLQGEDAVTVNNDCVDLTPYIREDILLEFPQHPLCDPECAGLLNSTVGKALQGSKTGQNEPGSSAWAALNKLKFTK